MAEDIFRGPGVLAGSLMDGRVEAFDGPAINYQGDSFPDVRYTPMAKDGVAPARIPVFFNNPYAVLCDNIPQLAATNVVAPAQQPTTTLGTVFTLATASVAVSTSGN